MAAKKGKIEVVKEFEFEGIKLGQAVKVGHYADKKEIVIGVDLEAGDFLITNSGLKKTIGITLREEIEAEGFLNVKVLEGYENIDGFQWSWADKDYLNLEEE